MKEKKEMFCFYIERSTIVSLDKTASDLKLSRSATARRMIETGIAALRKGVAEDGKSAS